jgi:hypothetical protein
MTQKEELEILRDLLWKIGNAASGYNVERIGNIVSEIRYGYCYGQSNSYEGQTDKERKKLRISSLKRLKKI